MSLTSEEKDILELIRVAALQPEQIEAYLPSVIQQCIAVCGCEEVDRDKVLEIAQERILSEEFLKKFTSHFSENFSHDEIKALIGFYSSDAMKKFFKTYSNTCLPIYSAFSEVVQGVIKAVSN